MTRASYFLIKYIPDLRRQEPINIGVVAWMDGAACLRFDKRSFPRVTKESRDLAEDALDLITGAIQQEFDQAHIRDEQDVYEFVNEHLRTPFGVADRRSLFLQEAASASSAAILRNEVDKLLDVLVKPVRRQPHDRSPSPKKALQSGYQSFLQKDALMPDYELVGHQTGVTRKVDFFVNHNTDIAIDVIELQRQTTRDNALETVDSLCRKAEDILAGGSVRAMIAHLPADIRPELHGHVQLIKQLISPIHELYLTIETNENLATVKKMVDARR